MTSSMSSFHDKGTTHMMFALRVLRQKYREGQEELRSVLVDLEKSCDRVPRVDLWCCMKKSSVTRKNSM